MRRVLVIGDVHFPFVNKRTCDRIYSAIESLNPNVVLQVGDLYDMFGQTRFASSRSVFTPAHEHKVSREGAEEFWERIRRANPKAKRIQLKGNHDDRPFKRLIEKSPELESFFSIKDYFEFDGVETIHDSFQEFHIDGVLYTHGHYTKLGAHMRYYLKRVVCGHSHVGGVIYENIHERVLWELNAGYAADKLSAGLKYRPTRTVKWTQGFGWVDERGPRFCPLPG